MGASWRGDRERNCARCVAGAGARDWVEEFGRERKRAGEGTTQLPVLSLTSLALCLTRWAHLPPPAHPTHRFTHAQRIQLKVKV